MNCFESRQKKETMLRQSLLFIGFLFLTSAAGATTFLINGETESFILQATIPRTTEGCASTEIHFLVDQGKVQRTAVCSIDPDRGGDADMTCRRVKLDDLRFYDRSGIVAPDAIIPARGGSSQGDVEPVEGPDGLLWLCREDEEAQQCICIPWFPE